MTDDKHTAGPWHLDNRKDTWNGAPISDANGIRICNLSRKADRPTSQKEANARLIAKAWTIPALRAALERTTAALENSIAGRPVICCDEVLAESAAALALAQEKE